MIAASNIPSEVDGHSEGSDMYSPAAQAYAKRQSMHTLRRRDGIEDLRPLTGASGLKERGTS